WLGSTSKPTARSDWAKRARVARIFARVACKCSWSSSAAVAPARLSTSQLYESFTFTSSRTTGGDATAKPKRRPARLYDLLNVRVTMTLGNRARLIALASAKSTYASSMTRTPRSSRASRSRDGSDAHVPVGEFGLATSVRLALGAGQGV